MAAALALASPATDPAIPLPPTPAVEPARAEPAAPAAAPAVQAAPPAAPAPTPAPTPAPAANPDEIVVAGKGAPRNDPAAAINEVSFEAVEAVDKAVVGPIADGYVKATPKPLRQGVHNVINNLNEPINFANSLLQFKIGRAARAVGRFGINSTLGLAGLFNFAARKPFNLPQERNGFANTMGFYGIGAGPYMYLPLIGSTSTRDLVGRLLDLSLIPGLAGKPFSSPLYATSMGIIRSLDDRVEIDEFLQRLRGNCTNPYAAQREYYLALREAEIAALRSRDFDLDARLPACLADGPLSRLGQAVPPRAKAPAGAEPVPAPAQAPAEPPASPQPPAVTPQM